MDRSAAEFQAALGNNDKLIAVHWQQVRQCNQSLEVWQV